MQNLLQVTVVGSMLAYLLQCGFYYHQRNRQSWETIQGKIRSTSGSWALFHNARVLMEMADYAERTGYPAEQLSSLRKNAMQLRLSALASR